MATDMREAPAGATRLLTDKEAARKVAKSRSGWLKDCRVGLTPLGIHLGRSIRWDERELDAWIRHGCPPRSRWEQIKKEGSDNA